MSRIVDTDNFGASRFYKVVENDYVLEPGFEP
jgi:hypothetical protein